MVMKRLFLFVAAPLAVWAAAAASADSARLCGKDAKPCVRYGAQVFQARCALCHGSDGLGEGVVPLSLPGYPSTNLLQPRRARDVKALRDVIAKGELAGDVSRYMPPWGDELTLTQVESVVLFVDFLRKDTDAARGMLRKEAATVAPSLKVGRALYAGRCALCHGSEGRGDGKMAAVIKDPPPFNLTYSRAPDVYLRDIVSKGGAALGRSPRMPPWGTDLTESELESVILHIKTLRNGS